jgi:hypothetical protein
MRRFFLLLLMALTLIKTACGETLPRAEAYLFARANQRNQKQAIVNWHFTTSDAHIKIHRLYPSIDG